LEARGGIALEVPTSSFAHREYSFLRRLIGDKPYGLIVPPPEYDKTRYDEITAAFPESVVWQTLSGPPIGAGALDANDY